MVLKGKNFEKRRALNIKMSVENAIRNINNRSRIRV